MLCREWASARAALAVLTLVASAPNARADYYDVTDYDLVRPPRPEGVHRAAVAFCETKTRADDSLADTPAFKACMLGRRYQPRDEHLVHAPLAPLRSIPGGLDGTYVYDDAAPGPERSEQEEEAAARACNGGVSRKNGTPTFNACMLARDWQFARFEPAGAVEAICRVADPTSTPSNLRSGPAGTIQGSAAFNGTLVVVTRTRVDANGKLWASIALYPHGPKLGWMFRNYLSCF